MGSSERPLVGVPLEEVAAAIQIAAGDSAEQREAEVVLMSALSRRLNLKLRPQAFADGAGAKVQVDGYCADPATLVEAWAHQGPPKSAQKNKVMTDALKMVWIEQNLIGQPVRKILLLSDERAAAFFMGRSWAAAALRHFDISVVTEELPTDIKGKVEAAQLRQFR